MGAGAPIIPFDLHEIARVALGVRLAAVAGAF